MVEFEVLFCQLCTFPRGCAWIARQAFQYSGSVAYLFPLTVAAGFEGGAVRISDRSRLLTYNLTVRQCTREDKLFVLASVFIATETLERESAREVYSFVARVSS